MRSDLIMKRPNGASPGPIDERERFVRFLVTGGVAAGVNVGCGVIFSFVFPYTVAVALAYLFGMTTAFLLARIFVFDAANGTVRGQYLRFAIVNAAAFVQVWFLSVGLARLVFPWLGFQWYSDTIAHMIGVASPIVTSYFGHKRFSFR